MQPFSYLQYYLTLTGSTAFNCFSHIQTKQSKQGREVERLQGSMTSVPVDQYIFPSLSYSKSSSEHGHFTIFHYLLLGCDNDTGKMINQASAVTSFLASVSTGLWSSGGTAEVDPSEPCSCSPGWPREALLWWPCLLHSCTVTRKNCWPEWGQGANTAQTKLFPQCYPGQAWLQNTSAVTAVCPSDKTEPEL